MIDLVREQEVMPAPPAHVMIQVINRNSFIIRDRFNGVPVWFKPNETVTISPTEAQHFFGYPGTKEEMAIYMAKRNGWNTIAHVQVDPNDGPDGLPLYQKYASNIHITTQEFELVPKGSKSADDGLDVDNMPVQEGHPDAPLSAARARDNTGAAVGKRAGSPVKLGGRRPGRPSKQKPATDPSFVPLG